VLLREVHHRVKNNLQLIASIMSMQMRRARSPETRALMQGLQERVMSLATVHKELYQTTGVADVRADELLRDVTRQIVALTSDRSGGEAPVVETDFAPIPLTPDQAVPLSLLLTEGLREALRSEARGEGRPVALSLREAAPGRAVLRIRGGRLGPEAPGAAPADAAVAGLGPQLLAAFAAQVEGELEQGEEEGWRVLLVDFPVAPLAGGEERRGGREALA
jgi:two-component system, sensor histidine kinase PdtaS